MLMGGEEHSAVIAALEPYEIKEIVSISPEVFLTDAFELIHPHDYDDPSKWLEITHDGVVLLSTISYTKKCY